MVKHENEYISINASYYDNHWCLIATHPNNKVGGKYDLCVRFIMAYFSALGQTIESSGGQEILSSAEVLAQGSVRGFIHKQHFNYCSQIHPLFALALQIVHFRHFIEMHGHGVLV